jgi:hypothetical protein
MKCCPKTGFRYRPLPHIALCPRGTTSVAFAATIAVTNRLQTIASTARRKLRRSVCRRSRVRRLSRRSSASRCFVKALTDSFRASLPARLSGSKRTAARCAFFLLSFMREVTGYLGNLCAPPGCHLIRRMSATRKYSSGGFVLSVSGEFQSQHFGKMSFDDPFALLLDSLSKMAKYAA